MPGIVVGVDGSRHAERALEWAMKEAAMRHVPVTVVAVHQVPVGWMGHGVPWPKDAELVDSTRAAAQELTDKVLAGLTGMRPQVKVEAANGLPAEVLLNVSADAEMIVLGSRGSGGFARLRLGSVTYQVSHHAHCPVVIVPHDDRD